MAQPPGGTRVGEQVVGQHAVQVEDGIAVEADLFGLAYKEFDCVLVIEDHLCFALILIVGRLPEIDQPFRVEQRVCIALKSA